MPPMLPRTAAWLADVMVPSLPPDTSREFSHRLPGRVSLTSAMLRPGTSSRFLVPFVLLALLVVSGCAATTGRVGAPPPGSTAEAIEILKLVNQARATARHCADKRYAATGPLSLEAKLARAAQLHSEDMFDNGYMGHVGSDGSTLVDRANRQGYEWSALGENVAYGYTSPASVVTGWLNSPGHCANIMNPSFTELGVGLEGTYWTQLFGRPL